jgi:hypothetical protein
VKPATSAPTGSPSSRSRGRPKVVVDLTQDGNKGKGKKPVLAMEGPEMHTTQRHCKKQVSLSISAFSFMDYFESMLKYQELPLLLSRMLFWH